MLWDSLYANAPALHEANDLSLHVATPLKETLTPEEQETLNILKRMSHAYSKRMALAWFRKHREQHFADKKAGNPASPPAAESTKMECAPESEVDIEKMAVERANEFADYVLRIQRLSELN